MPRGDGTGPSGMGNITGRAAGYCAGYPVPGFSNPAIGRYFGEGRSFFSGRGGRGQGHRNWYHATGLPGWYRYDIGMPAWGRAVSRHVYAFTDTYQAPDVAPDEEKEMLKQQADFLKQRLEDIQARVEELEKETEKKE